MSVDDEGDTAIAKIAVAASLSALLLGWIVATLICLATGPATVAASTAAEMGAPPAADLAPTHLSLLVLAIDAGSLSFSHVGDAARTGQTGR